MDREKHDQIVAFYWEIRERAEDDPEYLRLRAVAEELEVRYEAAVSALPQEIREAIELYIAGRESMGRRMLELACEQTAMYDDTLNP